MQGREQYALLQLVPGLTPSLTAGSFDGAVYNANGRDAGSNAFMLDGQSNKDDRTMALPQARVTVDSMAEFQVLTHEYGAEYGGSTGVIVNAITKSGTNQFHGRTFFYYQDEKLNAQNYFLKGQPKPDNGSKQGGGEHRRAHPPEQGVLLLQLGEDGPQLRAQSPVSGGSGAAGRLLLDVVRRQPDQLLRPGGLPGDPVEPGQLPRRLRAERRHRRERGNRADDD